MINDLMDGLAPVKQNPTRNTSRIKFGALTEDERGNLVGRVGPIHVRAIVDHAATRRDGRLSYALQLSGVAQ